MNKSARGSALMGVPQIRRTTTSLEVRSLDGGARVELAGYASTTEQPYTMYDWLGEYSEVISRGAFAKTLTETPQVVFLANHGDLPLASTASGSLVLEEDSTGLLSVARLNVADRQDARDLVAAIKDGDIREMSFAFRIVRQLWSPDYEELRIDEVNLDRGDVSAVTFGANPSTSIASRSFHWLGSARIAKMADKLRAGALDDATTKTLAHVLDLVAAADVAVDKAQPLIADLLGVPNPDQDAGTDAQDQDDDQRAAAKLEVLRMIEADRKYGRKAS